nr:hypothetical protein [Methanosarcina acetivorans]
MIVYVCGGCRGYTNVQTYCFNATTGEPVWSIPSKTADDGGIRGWTCSVAVADRLVYSGSEDDGYFGYGSLYSLDAFTGDVVWYVPYAGSSPALKGIRDPFLNSSGFTGFSGITISADDVEFSGFEIPGPKI